MPKRELYIVWNNARSESIVVDSEDDAMVAAGLLEPFSGMSSLCERFNELYSDESRLVEIIEL